MSKVLKALRNPKTALRFLSYRVRYLRLSLAGGDPESVSFYRKLQNEKVRQGEAYQRVHGIGEAQLEFLQREGLDPSDTVLDIGCGDLRGGKHIIEFLDAGNYTGMDISEEAIKSAWANLREWDMTDQNPTLLVNTDLKLAEFETDEFDWVFANSVLTHLSEDIISELLANLGRVLAEDGLASLSYHESEDVEKEITKFVSTSNLYRYPFETLDELCAEQDLDAERHPYEEHPADTMKMLLVMES